MKKPSVALIDGDILAFKACFIAQKDSLSFAYLLRLLDRAVTASATLECYCEEYEGFLTGPSNFRNDVFSPNQYKSGRKEVERPKWLSEAREYLVKEHLFVVSSYCEADDLLSMRQTELGNTSVIHSADKDLLMVPGWHYKTSHGKLTYVTQEQGLKTFYLQLLTGDRTDSIQGALKGLGPKTAEKLLKGVTDEQDMFTIALNAYQGDYARLVGTAHLLWMQRCEGQIWTPFEYRSRGHRVCNKDAGTGEWKYPSPSTLKEWFPLAGGTPSVCGPEEQRDHLRSLKGGVK